MNVAFYLAAAVAVLSTGLVITRTNAVHALLYLVVSFLASGVVFYVLGAPFAAVLEVIVYAGAIIVLFLFAVMLLNLGRGAEAKVREWLRLRAWVGPGLLAAVLLAELVYLIATGGITAGVGSATGGLANGGAVVTGAAVTGAGAELGPQQVGTALLGPYVLGVELASLLLLAGLVGAHHLTERRD